MTTWEENTWRPFCSERCKFIDLGKWASEEYKVPGSTVQEEEEQQGTETGSDAKEERT